MDKTFFTIQELSQYLGITAHSIYSLIARKKIPYSKPFGRKLYFLKSDIDALLFSRRVLTDGELESKVYQEMANKG